MACCHDRLGEVHRDREADALRVPGDGGVDADEEAGGIDERTPELPGLIAASVWMRLRSVSGRPPRQVSSMSMKRPIALTTPVVTELVKVPSGLPIAMASCPTPSADRVAQHDSR